ncbi:MAG TPA: hypothetical protein VGB77_05590 [Abditibacteriaceae bacterium]
MKIKKRYAFAIRVPKKYNRCNSYLFLEELIMKQRFLRLLESPKLMIPLMALLIVCAMSYIKADTRLKPPDITGHTWSQDSMLISYPVDDCGCAPVGDVVRMGLNHHLNVVILSPESQSELDILKSEGLPQERLRIVTNIDQSIMGRFSPNKKIGMALIRDGRVVRQSEGGIPSESFFK